MSFRQRTRSRAKAYQQQAGHCFYCRLPMWLSNPLEFAQHHGLTKRQTPAFQATAEHLVAASEGGGDGAANIVAACARCNHGRHGRKVPMSPSVFQRYVQQRIAKGRWHSPAHMLNLVRLPLETPPPPVAAVPPTPQVSWWLRLWTGLTLPWRRGGRVASSAASTP